MDCTELRKRLRLGEGLSTEFKRCGGQPGDDVFETVCSFAKLAGVSVRTAQRHIKKLVESGALVADEVDGRSYRRR